MLRWLILLFFSLLFARCNDMMQEAIKNVVQETHRKDSANERIRDYPISMDRYKIIERKKEGKDSLYIVRRFLLTGEKYCDISYRNNFMNGRAKFYYKSGQLSHVFIYQNDTVVTLNECYSPSGEKRPGTFAVRGTGLIQIFHPITHKLIYEYTLKNKLKHGRYLAWYENGNKAVECELDRDTLVNYYRGWYKTGALEMERKENKTTKLVTFFTYFPDNKIKRIEAWKNYQKQFIKEYDVEGRVTEDESITADNKLKGKKYYYGAKGQLLSRGSYIEGKKDGPYEYFYDNGNKKAIETYLEDVLLSEKRWHENGNLSVDAKYKNNLLEGIYKEYYPNGKLKLQQEYVLGTKHGKYLSYFINGNIYNDGYYEHGRPKGDMKFYSRKGKLDCIKNYK